MPHASPDYNIFVLNPDLVKEWHPTKNAGIKPSEVTPGSGKKIWWICSEGHEWQAVVYSRSRGSSCPVCGNSKSADHAAISVSNSAFKREWHPTANGDLNPAFWTTAEPAKVWWLCDKGHEWQAAFRARVKGNGCPVCDQPMPKKMRSRRTQRLRDSAATEKMDPLMEIEPLEEIFGADFRKIKRYKTTATVTIEVPSTQHLFYAEMKNFSHEGLCLETSTSLTPGTRVHIKLDRPLFATSPESYDSVIRWCKGLTDEDGSVYNYGLGVKFL